MRGQTTYCFECERLVPFEWSEGDSVPKKVPLPALVYRVRPPCGHSPINFVTSVSIILREAAA